jgi:ubiquinone/menaquinone biosynthesis C-methylase UbiE
MTTLYQKIIYCPIMNHALGDRKTCMLRDLLLENASGKILEIGFGSGLNLPHYPGTVHEIHAIDTHCFASAAQSTITVHFEKIPAEMLGFPDDSFDTVVSTFTLCSVADVSKVLQEVRRVLKPGGKFLFIEHGKSWNKVMIAVQQLSNPFFRALAGGCNVNRDFLRELENSGLKIEILRHIRSVKQPISGFYYFGMAIKTSIIEQGEK